jgi:hypothetical protein
MYTIEETIEKIMKVFIVLSNRFTSKKEPEKNKGIKTKKFLI